MSIGIWQVALVLLAVLILFGAGKLPSVMGDLAKGIRTFKAGLHEGETAPVRDIPDPTPRVGTERS